ncbi:MAG: rubredoxin [Spirochaetes bacterium]|uniref:Rubredoxin n=1 Tax=Candidatus Ornithospirochaeta stercoripullorum TaxID=2840899 RepID=A0A9D9E2E0_9SPIO|nr:rubredoxin [Candidatus Ornithospirochaeta stercoripullorum]
MKYTCSVCGYVYDEEVEGVQFSSLPDDWKCPMCGAPKNLFESESTKESTSEEAVAETIDEDSEKLSPGILAAIFSNLARGAEKQYLSEPQQLYSEIAEYFTKAVPAKDKDINKASVEELSVLYPKLRSIASANKDRGALRVTVWGEKVTRMIKAITDGYMKEGEDYLKNNDVWVCTVCGFIYIGEKPPRICPVCKVPDWKFECIKEEAV